jgi:hypothetical protein
MPASEYPGATLSVKKIVNIYFCHPLSDQGRLLQGVSICDSAPSITHLLFADDSQLLLKVNQRNADHLKYVLQLYDHKYINQIELRKVA